MSDVQIVDCVGMPIEVGMKVIFPLAGSMVEAPVLSASMTPQGPLVAVRTAPNHIASFSPMKCVVRQSPNPQLFLATGLVHSNLVELIADFASHQSWRCEYRDRYPWDDDCPCGLLKALRTAGLPESWAGSGKRNSETGPQD